MPEQEQMDLIPKEQPIEDPQLQAERESARQRLAELLKDPKFRAIEGFPIGEDEAILELSDPPYYTACPNPFIPDIIEKWQQEREETRQNIGLKEDRYQREPFASDVSEGKNNPIYNAHTYHTKVPHKAIMRYILHYTDPGDIVFDGFCGTGMTGVATQLCGNAHAIEDLGYHINNDVVWDSETAISHLGERKIVMNDLSPVATFIAQNYNNDIDVNLFKKEAKRILKSVKDECGWMYETWHPTCDHQNRKKAYINYTVWSEVFRCPNCGGEMVFWESAVDPDTGYRTSKESPIECKECGIATQLLNWERTTLTEYDPIIGQTVAFAKRVPVLINYTLGNKKIEKIPDAYDLEVIKQIEAAKIAYWFPHNPILFKGEEWGDTWRAGIHIGLTHTHHFYTKRNLWSWSSIYTKVNEAPRSMKPGLLFWIQSVALGHTILNRYLAASYSQVNRYLKGTMYIAPFITETSPWFSLSGKINSTSLAHVGDGKSSIISTGSASHLIIDDNSIDYIFTDPPFGSNIMYSDLNFIWEEWLRVITNTNPEAIINKSQEKSIAEFQELIRDCFREYYRILKPGRWMTVEFHNSRNTVWNAIQETILQAGFVIADVRTLDKQQVTMQQMISQGAVKQDLIISAYKPNGNLEDKFRLKAGTEEGVWDFVRYHLGKLPSTNYIGGSLGVNAERQAFLLFDRMVAFHIQRGVMVPISAPDFYAGLEQRFTRRDGMYFLPDQVAEYDRALLNSNGIVQLQMFVTGEKSAIAWLRQELDPNANGKPQTQADLNPKFKLVLHQAKHEQSPELIEILEQNFLQDEQMRWYVPDPNKASDLEKVRQRSLLREFKEYLEGRGRLRLFRTEAVRAGFLEALRKQEYDTIIKVAERLPEDVLREDPDMLMYYDSAMLRRK